MLGHTLRDFKMSETKCFDEEDRKAVYKRIRETWGSLEAFDTYVRNDVYQTVVKTIGKDHMYHSHATMSMPFFWLIFWAGMNSPETPAAESFLGAISFGFLACPLAIAWWHRIGALVCTWYPTKPVRSTLTVAVLCFVSCFMHTYVHNCILWLAFRLRDAYGTAIISAFLIVPLFFSEACFLHKIHKQPAANTFQVHTWTKLDTLYYAFWSIIALCILVGMNGVAAVAGQQIQFLEDLSGQ